jgi:hypothetical protein
MAITIRLAEIDDAQHISRLIRDLAESLGETSPITPAYAADYLALPSSYCLLGEVDAQVVGLLTCSIKPNLYHAGDTKVGAGVFWAGYAHPKHPVTPSI